MLVHTLSATGAIGDTVPAQNELRAGGRQAVAQYFQGRLDEVRVYRSALGAGEVAGLAGVTASSTTANIQWLVTDHLGTPRMVVDQTGNLDKIKRHDYLPFGEELFAGTGGRTTQQGYSQPDGVRQKFTSKERDDETGLDYFGARYYSSSQGRFTSPDPLLGSAVNFSPLTWNRYTYGRNNPLRNIDPLGLYDWDVSAGGSASDEALEARRNNKQLKKKERNQAKSALEFRQRFRASLVAADNAADSSTLSADQQQQVQESVDAYGTENDSNGVIVGVRDNARSSKATALLNENDTITVTFNDGLKGDKLTVTLAHEGRHVADVVITASPQ